MKTKQRELPERVPVIRREEVRRAWQRMIERRRRAGLSTWEMDGDLKHLRRRWYRKNKLEIE